MITRRGFFGMLAALPLVGKWMPSPYPMYLVMKPIGEVWYSVEPPLPPPFDPDVFIAAGGKGYVIDDNAMIARLAEYMRRVQVEEFNHVWETHHPPSGGNQGST